MIGIVSAILTAGICVLAPRSADRLASVDESGVMRWSDNGCEVSLMGVNYYVPFNWDYRQIAKKGLDHKEVIRRDVAHFRRLGVEVLRMHCHDSDLSRADGSLRDNEHWDLLDFIIAECASNGIYSVLTPIAAWGGDWFSGAAEGFSYNVGVKNLFADHSRWPAQIRYLKEFASHTNRYTGKSIGTDPAVLCFELVNEPKYPKDASGEDIAHYANTLRDALRGGGTDKPIFYNATWATYAGKTDPALAALPYLKTEGVSGVCYCTGLLNRKAHEGLKLDTVRKSTLSIGPATKRFAKMIYEFDAADIPGAYMYPAMAAMFRRDGAQIAAQFQYDPLPTADVNASYQTHYLNLFFTPAKALSLAVAIEAFGAVPRHTPFTPHTNELHFLSFRVNAESNLSEYVSPTRFYYTASTQTMPPAPEKLEHIWGCGRSSVAASTGNGAYFLDKISKGCWLLQLGPDTENIADPYTGQKGVKTKLLPREIGFGVRLADLGENYRATRIQDLKHIGNARNGRMMFMAGSYILSSGSMPAPSKELAAFAQACGFEAFNVQNTAP